jgi:hypothetical protein
MKSSKSVFIALAFVLGIGGALASKAAQRVTPLSASWYVFNGNPSQISDPSKYSLSPTDPDCTTGSDRCAVLAQPSTSNPNQPNLATITQEEFKN